MRRHRYLHLNSVQSRHRAWDIVGGVQCTLFYGFATLAQIFVGLKIFEVGASQLVEACRIHGSRLPA